MNYVERHFGDWARDTSHLSMVEDGAYNRLCDLYYVREKPLPASVAECCRLVRAATAPERKAVQAVLEEFFHLDTDGRRHRRCDAEIERFRSKSGKATASAKARWEKSAAHSERNANASADAMRTHSERSKNAMPHARGTNHQAPSTTTQPSTKGAGSARGAQTLEAPDGVNPQTWADWLALRKAKKAPVTATVIAGAVAEAAKAGMALGDFLAVWCARGSQGLQADWLKPSERQPAAGGETAFQRERRERVAEMTGGLASRKPPAATQPEVIDATPPAARVG